MNIKIFFRIGFLVLIYMIGVSQANAEEYQCNVSAINAVECEAYVNIKHVCPFPEELNVVRTQESQTGRYTYPVFCAETCANNSAIPQKCRAGRITPLTSMQENVIKKNKKENFSKDQELRGGSIPRDFNVEYDTQTGKFWHWIKNLIRGDNYEIKSMSTPVAGVRG